MKYNKSIYFLIISSLFIFNSCGAIRDSAGVTRKDIDEYKSIENPPLVIPPDFALTDPDKLEEKKIEDVEKDLAKEILFGLENEKTDQETLSTMDQILFETKAEDVSPDIRKEIDEKFSQQKNTEGVFNKMWEDEVEILDAIEESKLIREKTFSPEKIFNDKIPIKKGTIKKNKKKRFIFF